MSSANRAATRCAPPFRSCASATKPDFFVVNGENSAGGNGITPRLAVDLMRAGADVITLGDHAWDQREIVPYFATEPRLLRPLNFPAGTPGFGSVVVDGNGQKLGVINVLGRTFMGPQVDNPFLLIEAEIEKLKQETACILIDFHAEATSEKIAFGRAVDGLATLVVGTHTHVQTADDRIFPGGTAYLTDAGFCGPHESVIGRDIAQRAAKIPHAFAEQILHRARRPSGRRRFRRGRSDSGRGRGRFRHRDASRCKLSQIAEWEGRRLVKC